MIGYNTHTSGKKSTKKHTYKMLLQWRFYNKKTDNINTRPRTILFTVFTYLLTHIKCKHTVASGLLTDISSVTYKHACANEIPFTWWVVPIDNRPVKEKRNYTIAILMGGSWKT